MHVLWAIYKKKVEECRVNKIIIEKVEEEIISSMKYIEGNIDISKIDNQLFSRINGRNRRRKN